MHLPLESRFKAFCGSKVSGLSFMSIKICSVLFCTCFTVCSGDIKKQTKNKQKKKSSEKKRKSQVVIFRAFFLSPPPSTLNWKKNPVNQLLKKFWPNLLANSLVTKRHAWFLSSDGYKSWKNFLKKVNFEKNLQTIKSMQNFPACKE